VPAHRAHAAPECFIYQFTPLFIRCILDCSRNVVRVYRKVANNGAFKLAVLLVHGCFNSLRVYPRFPCNSPDITVERVPLRL